MENVAIIESIGAYLKSLREQKKLTLEEISQISRIKVRLLEEIENDVFSNLGGVGYAKAMIINYARHLDADEEKILASFNEKFNQKPIHIPRDKSIEEKKFVLPANFLYLVLLIVLILFLTFLVIYLYKNDVISWPPFSRNEKDKIEVKEDLLEPKTGSEDTLKADTLATASPLTDLALHDTTDYLNELLFKDKISPFNYEE